MINSAHQIKKSSEASYSKVFEQNVFQTWGRGKEKLTQKIVIRRLDTKSAVNPLQSFDIHLYSQLSKVCANSLRASSHRPTEGAQLHPCSFVKYEATGVAAIPSLSMGHPLRDRRVQCQNCVCEVGTSIGLSGEASESTFSDDLREAVHPLC